jgi:hypothetical protein
VSLVYDASKRKFGIVESCHELAAYDLTISGKWPNRVQVDGRHFRHVIETYRPNEILELAAYPDRLEIRSERSPFSMPRLDAPGRSPIETKPIPPHPRHKGKLRLKEEPFRERVELDATWDFSARMPVPQHQIVSSIKKPEGTGSPRGLRSSPRDSGMADLFGPETPRGKKTK